MHVEWLLISLLVVDVALNSRVAYIQCKSLLSLLLHQCTQCVILSDRFNQSNVYISLSLSCISLVCGDTSSLSVPFFRYICIHIRRRDITLLCGSLSQFVLKHKVFFFRPTQFSPDRYKHDSCHRCFLCNVCYSRLCSGTYNPQAKIFMPLVASAAQSILPCSPMYHINLSLSAQEKYNRVGLLLYRLVMPSPLPLTANTASNLTTTIHCGEIREYPLYVGPVMSYVNLSRQIHSIIELQSSARTCLDLLLICASDLLAVLSRIRIALAEAFSG